MAIVETEGECGLLVREVLPRGLMSDWNAQASVADQVKGGMTIVKVNDVAGSAEALIAELQASVEVVLSVERGVCAVGDHVDVVATTPAPSI